MAGYNYDNSSAVGLSVQGRADDHLFNTLLTKQRAAKAAKTPSISSADFLSTGQLLPFYDAKAKQELASYGNELQQYKQIYGDTQQAVNKWLESKPIHQANINSIAAQNDEAKRLLNANSDENYTDYKEALGQVMNNSNATNEDLQKAMQPHSEIGINTDNTGGVWGNLKKRADAATYLKTLNEGSYIPQADANGVPTGVKTSPVQGLPGVMAARIPLVITDDKHAANGSDILGNENLLFNYLHQYRPNLDPNKVPPELKSQLQQKWQDKSMTDKQTELALFSKYVSPPRASETLQPINKGIFESQANPTYDMLSRYSTNTNGDEYASINPKATMNPLQYEGYTTTDASGKNVKINPVGIPSGFQTVNGKLDLVIKVPKDKESFKQKIIEGKPLTDADAETVLVPYTHANADQWAAQTGQDPFAIRAAANKAAGIKGNAVTVAQPNINKAVTLQNMYKPSVPVKTSATQVKVEPTVKAYTRAELKALSSAYTDDVIDKAVKSGKIKLK